MREDFMEALDRTITEFAADIGISDEEIVATLLAKVRAIHKTIREREGVEEAVS